MFGKAHKNAQLLAAYRQGLRAFLEDAMEHELTHAHLWRTEQAQPYDTAKFDGIARMVRKFRQCFAYIEPEHF